MLSLGTPDRRSWDRRVERHEAASLVNREGEQIKVGDLARPVNSVAIGDAGIQQADVIRPELVFICAIASPSRSMIAPTFNGLG